MNQETSTVKTLVSLLKESNRSLEEIVNILASIIQQKQMYGGDISDNVNYWIDKVKKELHK